MGGWVLKGPQGQERGRDRTMNTQEWFVEVPRHANAQSVNTYVNHQWRLFSGRSARTVSRWAALEHVNRKRPYPSSRRRDVLASAQDFIKPSTTQPA